MDGRDESDSAVARRRLQSDIGAGVMAIVDHSARSVDGPALLEVCARHSLAGSDCLSLVYTPGVGRVATRIAAKPAEARELTGLANSVAVVAAVEPGDHQGSQRRRRALESQAFLLHRLCGLDAFPILVEARDQLRFGDTLAAISPSFGGIVLTGTAASDWHSFERQLQARIGIPVFDKDRYATAIVAVAALDNALARVHKTIQSARVVITGTGSVASAVARLLGMSGVNELRVWDPARRVGRVATAGLSPNEAWLARQLPAASHYAALSKALAGADVLIHTVPGRPLKRSDVDAMTASPIVLALAALDHTFSEVMNGTAATVATTDPRLPNFLDVETPTAGLMSAAVDGGATFLSSAMRLAVLRALVDVAHEAGSDSPFGLLEPLDDRVVRAVEMGVRLVIDGRVPLPTRERITVP